MKIIEEKKFGIIKKTVIEMSVQEMIDTVRMPSFMGQALWEMLDKKMGTNINDKAREIAERGGVEK